MDESKKIDTCIEEIEKQFINFKYDESLKNETDEILNRMDMIIDKVTCIYKDLSKDEREKISSDNGLEGLIADCMGVGIYGAIEINTEIYKLGFDKLISDSKQIVLFGNNEISKLVCGYLRKYDQYEKVCHFIKRTEITDKDEEVINSINCKELLLIVTERELNKKTYDSILHKFQKVLKIDFEIEEIMRSDIKETAIV